MPRELRLLKEPYWPIGGIPQTRPVEYEATPLMRAATEADEPEAYETPRLFTDAEEGFKALLIFLGLGVGARMAAVGVPEWIRLAVTTLVFWAILCALAMLALLLWQSRRKFAPGRDGKEDR